MRTNDLVKLGLVACLMTPMASVQATSQMNYPQAVRISEGDSAARTSILMPASTECPGPGGWYAFENSDSRIGRLWTELAREATTSGKRLFIQGNGVCDRFGFEGVTYIDLLAN